MPNTDYDDDAGIEDVGGREVEASTGSGLDRIANVSGDEIKEHLQGFIAEKADDGVSRDNDEPEEEAPAKLSNEDYDAAWASFSARYPDASDLAPEMADYLERHPNKHSSPRDRGELVHELENVYASTHGGIDLQELGQAARDDVLDQAETHYLYTDDAVGALETLVSKLGPDDERVGSFLAENPEVQDALITARQEEALDSTVSAIGKFLDGKSKEAMAYQASPQLQEMTQGIIESWDLDPALLLDPTTAVDVYQKAIRSADEIIAAERTGEKTLIVPGDGGIAELREIMFRTSPDALAELNATSSPYPEIDFEDVFNPGAGIVDLTAHEARQALRGRAEQSADSVRENERALERSRALREAQNRRRGRQSDGTPSPKIGV